MVLTVQTLANPCEVELKIESFRNDKLRLVGYCANKEKYFDRNIDTIGSPMVFNFGCPVSPDQLFIKVESANGRPPQVRLSHSLKPLKSDFILNPKVREYCEFVKEFCGKYHLYPAGKRYSSSSGRFKVRHNPVIMAANGSKSITPARIHKREHYIEVSKEWFSGITIPMRAFILCHEFSHVYLNNDPLSETEADINGAKLYLSMGFPVIELIYSFTKVFGDNPQTHERANNVMNYLNSIKNG